MESFVEKYVHHFGCRLRGSPHATFQIGIGLG